MPEKSDSVNRLPLRAKDFSGAGGIQRDSVGSPVRIIWVARTWRQRVVEGLFRLDVPLHAAPQFCLRSALLAATEKGCAACSVLWNHVPDSRNFC